MPRPMTRQAFKERLHENREAIGIKFSQPPATQPNIEMPDAADIWNLLDLTEELIRRSRRWIEEAPPPIAAPVVEVPAMPVATPVIEEPAPEKPA